MAMPSKIRNFIIVAKSALCVQAFDELLLLKRGGRPIYCGPLGTFSADMVAYFQARLLGPLLVPFQPNTQPQHDNHSSPHCRQLANI